MLNIGHKSGQIWQTDHFEKVDTKVHNKFKYNRKSFVLLEFARSITTWLENNQSKISIHKHNCFLRELNPSP